MAVGKIQKIISMLYAIARSILPPCKLSNSDKILLVEMGHIGDAIIDASAWSEIMEYAMALGKEVYLYTTWECQNILKKILGSEKITYLTCQNELFDVNEYKKSLSVLKGMTFDTIISRPHCNKLICLLVATIPAIKRYAVFEEEIFLSKIYNVFADRYSTVIYENRKSREKDVLEKLVEAIGIKDYCMRILPIAETKEKIARHDKYITIAVDSQNSARRWPTDSFIALIMALLAIFEDDIVLTGSSLPREDNQQYEDAFHKNERVKNMIGRCSLDEWIDLLRGARFHIGVDSGSIHIAASVGTKAFCLTGVWHGHRFFPYNIKEYQPGTTAPVCVYRQDVDVEKIPCYGCAAKKEYGWGNRECLKKCRTGFPCLCLEEITVDDVMDSIEKAIRDGKIN